MFTVKQISEKTGVSVRALHHYDAIGLLKPAALTDAGYRLYDDTAVEKLYEAAINSLTAQDIQSVLQAILAQGNFIEVTLAPQE